MAKLTTNDIDNLQNEQSVVNTINNNFAAVESAMENTLSRDGTTPNQMESDLDMNSNPIYNLPRAYTDTEPVRKQEFDATISNITASGIQLPTSGIIAYDHEAIMTYTREIQTDTNGIDIVDGDGVNGDPIISLTGNVVAIADLNSATDTLPYFTDAEEAALTPFTSYARTLVDDETSSDARATLGVVIGTDVQAYDQELAALAGLTSAADKLPYFTGAATAATTDFTAFARTILDDGDAATVRQTLGVVLGTDVQPHDAELDALAGLTSAADKLPYFTGSGTASLADFTTYGRSLVDDSDAATARTTLGLVIGTDVQAYDAELQALSGLTSAADALPYFTGTGTAATTTLTSAARNLIDDASAGDMRTTLGLGSLAVLSSVDDGNWSGTDLAVTNGGTGASDASGARTNLGLVIGTDVQAHDAQLDDVAATTPTKGNILVGNGTNWATLGVGTDGNALLADSGSPSGLAWGSGGGGGGGAPTDATYLTLNTNASLSDERVLTAGTGIGFTDAGAGSTLTVALSHLGIQSLTDPNADRIMFWDDSAGAMAWLDLGSYLSISGTTLATTSAVAKLDVEDQALTGGVIVTSKSLGTQTTGTLTPDPGDRPVQHYTNGGAHTLAPSSNVGSILLDITNNGSAGAITTSGFTKVVGDSFTTTNTHKFRCHISIGDGGSLLQVQAFQ